MPELTDTTPPVSDAQLIAAVRAGDLEAYGDLFGRHRDAATRLARQLVPAPDADDLVAEAFIRVMSVLQAGKGPDEFFRAYLLSSIRRLHIDRIRAGKRVRPTGDEAELDRAIEFVDPAEMKFEQAAAAAAFAALPERWQLVLWHLDVEGQKPAELAGLLGMSPNSVSALAYRAREGLRRAYLQGHLAPAVGDGCQWATTHLGQHVRKGLSAKDAAKVEKHLDGCPRCSALHLELIEVNTNLGALLAPAILGTAAAGYLGSGTSVGVAGSTGWLARRLDSGSRTGALVATALAIVAVLAIAAVAVSHLIEEDTPRTSADVAGPNAAATTGPPGMPDRTSPSASNPAASPTASPPSVSPAPAASLPGVPARLPPAALPSTSIDFRVAASSVDEAAPFQRRITIAAEAEATDAAPRDTTLTVSLSFGPRAIYYRGGSFPGWSCDPPEVNRPVRVVQCSRTQTGRAIPPIAVSIFGCVPEITAVISAARNTDATDNSTTVRVGDYGRDTPPTASCAVATG